MPRRKVRTLKSRQKPKPELNLPPDSELAKLHAVAKQSNLIGQFLEASSEDGRALCERHEHDDGCFSPEDGHRRCGLREGEWLPVQKTIEQILAKYFGIDLVKIAAEKDAILQHIRERQIGGER